MPDANTMIEAARRRAIHGAMRCIRGLLVAIGRDYERCGKAACARSRRCRGFACKPDRGLAKPPRRPADG